MTQIEKLYRDLENSFIFDKRHDNFLAILEALFGLTAGGFIGSIIQNFNKHDLTFGIIFSILFLYFFFRRYSKEKYFSISALGELKSTSQLKETEKEVERKIIIDTYIEDAIKSLNSNTCNYIDINIDNHLCDTSIEIGLKSIFQPYFDNPQNLLDTPKAKFTVGAYLNWILKLPIDFGKIPSPPDRDFNIFIPRDDFQLRNSFDKDILKNSNLFDDAFLFQTQFLDTFKHTKFINSIILIGDKSYNFITSPIPTVCEDGSTGVFFMIFENVGRIPDDFENLTNIFSRLFSNWLSKYNECINDRCVNENNKLGQSSSVHIPTREINLSLSQPDNGSLH
ncbi:MAG: hypothetical protein ACTHML_09250 [Ginsengibacter sp.]